MCCLLKFSWFLPSFSGERWSNCSLIIHVWLPACFFSLFLEFNFPLFSGICMILGCMHCFVCFFPRACIERESPFMALSFHCTCILFASCFFLLTLGYKLKEKWQHFCNPFFISVGSVWSFFEAGYNMHGLDYRLHVPCQQWMAIISYLCMVTFFLVTLLYIYGIVG